VPEEVKEITKLAGLNLRQETADLEDVEASKLVNLDPFQQPGTWVVRRGRTLLVGSLSDFTSANFTTVVRTIAKVNEVRYQVVGRMLFRNGVAIGEGLSNELQTTIKGFRPLNDSAIWAFIADDAGMTKDDGTNIRLWGLTELPTPKPKLANQTGKTPGDTITAGTYQSAVTQIRFDT